ncbi:MAG: hypothetical protein ACREOL_01235 [Candidatus Dormibacteria bacterium]
MPLAVTAICLRGLAHPGYVLQVDSVFGPRSPAATWGFSAPIQLATHLLGGWLAGRVFVALALYLCCFGPMVLLRHRHWLVQVLGGLLGALNPWVFGRLVEGQWGVAASVGVMFLWLGAWERLSHAPGWASSLACASLAWLAVTFDQHAIGPLLVLAVASIALSKGWRQRRTLAWGAASFGLLAAASVYGWVPFFLGHGPESYATVRLFSRSDLLLFRSSSNPTYGLWPNLVGLFGFWPERLGRIPLLNAGAAWWPIPVAVLSLAAVAGCCLRRERAWLLAAGLVGLGAAASTATGPGLTVMLWLMLHLPVLGAFREPEKWSALWLLALVVLGAESTARLIAWAGSRSPIRSSLAGLGLACILLSVVLPDGVGALRELPATVVPVTYPKSWTQLAAYMHQHLAPANTVVILPWELYEPLALSRHRLVHNPAPALFPGRLLSPQDAEIGRTASQPGPDGIAKASLEPASGSCHLLRAVRRLGADWVVVEPAPHGLADLSDLLRCGAEQRSGSVPGPVLLRP